MFSNPASPRDEELLPLEPSAKYQIDFIPSTNSLDITDITHLGGPDAVITE
jgi:hypothetical protein